MEFKQLFKSVRRQYQAHSALFQRKQGRTKDRKPAASDEPHRTSAFMATSAEFGQDKFRVYQTRSNWGKITSRRSSATESVNFLSVEGGIMKSAIFAAALLMVGCFSLPVLAQQPELQELMNATNALGTRESDLLSKKDAAGIASLFTSDALLVMLAPHYGFKPGRDAILKHYQGIIDAGATGITLELKNLELRSNDSIWAAGNYSVTVKDKTIRGNWFRILRRENGTWKIAMEGFARADDDRPPAAPADSK
jgi:ketosteroid isomerase-like protein